MTATAQVDCADADCSAHPACVVLLSKPLCAGATQVTGSAQRGQTVQLRNVNTGYMATTVAGSDNTFTFSGPRAAGGTYGGGLRRTARRTGTSCGIAPSRPRPLPPRPRRRRLCRPPRTPSTAYITLSPTCGGPGTGITITVRGHNWTYQNQADHIPTISWDGTRIGEGHPVYCQRPAHIARGRR
jgi:hypothetical protein